MFSLLPALLIEAAVWFILMSSFSQTWRLASLITFVLFPDRLGDAVMEADEALNEAGEREIGRRRRSSPGGASRSERVGLAGNGWLTPQPIKTMTSWRLILQLPAHFHLGAEKSLVLQSRFDLRVAKYSCRKRLSCFHSEKSWSGGY